MVQAVQKIKPEDDGTGSGIVSSTIKKTDGVSDTAVKPAPGAIDAPKADSYGSTEIKTAEVNDPTDTVEGRLANLTSGESKYVDLAKNEAIKTAASRGLINSTMAAGAGTEAAIRQALPIAQQDAKTYSDQRIMNQTEQNKAVLQEQKSDLSMREAEQATNLQKDVNRQNADLNMEIDAFSSTLAMNEEAWAKELQVNMEKTLANTALSNDMKIQYVQAINGITADTQAQIADIGLSDRTPEAQAAAIFRLEQNRDASIKVYEDLLASSDSWEWSTNFTPEATTTLAEQSNYWNAPGGAQPVSEPKVGDYVGGQYYQGNGVWSQWPTGVRPANDQYDNYIGG